MREGRLGFVLVACMASAAVMAPFAIARTGSALREGQRNPGSGAASRETRIIARTQANVYGTRQSNKSNSGGGAIYGCRSMPGGSPANNEPCIRANNLNTGLAFEFETDGTISAKPGDAGKPFITNATGGATGLNADRVDGKHAADIVKDASAAATAAAKALTPLALVKSDGAPVSSRGVEPNGVTRSAAGDYDVKFTGDLSTCALSATVTGTAAGQVTVTPTVAADKKTTTVDVRTFDGGGTAAAGSMWSPPASARPQTLRTAHQSIVRSTIHGRGSTLQIPVSSRPVAGRSLIRHRSGRTAMKKTCCIASALACAGLVAATPATAAVTSTKSATKIARAIVKDSSQFRSARWIKRPLSGRPAAVSSSKITGFPVSGGGSTFGLLSTGDATKIRSSNSEEDLSHNNRGFKYRGTRDTIILRIDITAPRNARCLSLNFRFLSEEYPEYIDSEFNDAFIAEADKTT